MTETSKFEIFLAVAPGLEALLLDEVRSLGFGSVKPNKGGVSFLGTWADVWRANLEVRGASRVLARLASFRVTHLAHLDKLSRKIAWGDVLRADRPVAVEASCKTSRIYHSGAAQERVERAIAEELGAPIDKDAAVTVTVRLESDMCTVSVDTSGALLHKRGHKEAVNAAPMRETMAALFLRQCGYRGEEPVIDPMCGSGTFVIEAAEMALGLKPGRGRAFAFEQLATFHAEKWQEMRGASPPKEAGDVRFFGRDRDAGAIRMSRENAERAGVAAVSDFQQMTVSELAAPPGQPGLVIANAPYGARLGDAKSLMPLYRAFGSALRTRFSGWRVGLITTDAALAHATELPFLPTSAPVAHGGLRVKLYRTEPLP